MTAQQQKRRPDLPLERLSQRLQSIRWLIASIILFFIVAGTIIWILADRNGFITTLPIVIFTVLGVLIALFQWLFPVSSSSSEHTPVYSHLPQILPQDASAVQQIQPGYRHVPTTQFPVTQSSLAEKTSFRGIVGLPPPADPRTIQQREQVVREVYTKLIQPDITAIVLTGIGGVGKSTLAALTYHYVEEQRLASACFFPSKTLWFTIDPAVTFADLASNLFEALGKPLPVMSRLAPHNQAVALFNALNTTDTPCLIILDQFENLLNWNTGHALTERPGVGEWLDIVNSQSCACRILFTSRSRPVGTRKYPSTYLQEYPVRGLTMDEGVALLHNQHAQGTEAEFQIAVTRCSGHAFSLTLLASLVQDHQTDLPTLLKNTTLWTGDIASNLLDRIYAQRLTEVQRNLLLAFSIYREPVALEAALAIVTNALKSQVQLALKALVIQHLLEAPGGSTYQLHTIIADYAQDQFAETHELARGEVLQLAHAKAAQYYTAQASKTCPARGQRRLMNDVHDLIEAVWHLCQAEMWQDAYHLMEQEDLFVDVHRWGGNTILLELYQPMLDQWQPDERQAASIYYHLGEILKVQGPMEQARSYLEQALHIYMNEKDLEGQAKTLNQLGIVYYDFGQKEQARIFHERALEVFKEAGDRLGEGMMLNHLGRTLDGLGQKVQAQKHYEQAFHILTALGNRRERGWTLYSLGRIYNSQGKQQQALAFFEEALTIFREDGDRGREGWALISLGKVYEALGENERAQVEYQRALQILKEVGNRRGEARAMNNLGEVYDASGNREQAQKYYEQALSVSKEIGDYGGEGWTLNNLGRAYMSQNKVLQARKCFEEALNIYKKVEDRSGEIWTFYNIGFISFERQLYDVTLACSVLIKGAADTQLHLYDEAQSWIGKIQQEIGNEQYSTLLATVERHARQIVERVLHDGSLFVD